MSTILADERLSWVDATWINSGGRLWMPAAQLHRMSNFQGGADQVQPVQVFTLQLDGVGPASE